MARHPDPDRRLCRLPGARASRPLIQHVGKGLVPFRPPDMDARRSPLPAASPIRGRAAGDKPLPYDPRLASRLLILAGEPPALPALDRLRRPSKTASAVY